MKLRTAALLLGLFCLYWFSVCQRVPFGAGQAVSPGRVVVSAPILVGLLGGDRFLAANVERMRLSATGLVAGQADLEYLLRAHRVVSELNPCLADNYYLANALLSWGGAVDVGQEVLLNAVNCRKWDELPPFFYGFNKYFFERDADVAVEYIREAASRASDNRAGFLKMSVMLRSEQFQDERLALEFLRAERDAANDQKLRSMLDKRVSRVEGLVALRDAQRTYERIKGKSLVSLEELLKSGLLEAEPVDPLGLGYEFREGSFNLKKLVVSGVGREY